MPIFPFPDRPRLWGVAVSHYQVEGNDPCDWTEWEAAGRTRGERCGAAVGSWERYEQDVDLAVQLGANAFRFSISWSRVEPKPGEFDNAALMRYRRLVEHMRSRGVEPIVSLFHYTHPTWFHHRSPWTSPSSVDVFRRYARRCAQALGPAVRCYTVINEPLVFVLAGFVDAQIPPGIADSGAAARALDHLFAAHVEARAAIREIHPGAAIGIAHNMMGFAPDRREHFLDRLLSRTAHRFYNMALLEAFATGRWKFYLPPGTLLRGRRDELAGSLDFFGVNFYSRLHLQCPGKVRRVGDFHYRDRDGHGLTDNGWEITPETLGALLRDAATLELPILVTENGIADAGDQRRSDFLTRHVEVMEKAIREGIPLAGYLHWSLLDNYEWLDGFGPRFGLAEVDRPTMTRTPRRSAETFRQLGESFLRQAASSETAQESVRN